MPGQQVDTGLRVLVVEDSVQVGKSLCALIGGEHQTTLVANVEDAQLAIAESAYDVVLSDDRLPEPAGVEFLERVREEQPQAV